MSRLDLRELEDGTFTLRAAWFFSGEGEPLSNVAIEVTDRVITDIHQLSGSATASQFIVIPPLVNAHTHLELSDCPEPIPAGRTFPDWIRQVIAHRTERTDSIEATRIGTQELAASGTAVVADTVPADMPIRATGGIGSFIEYIGLTDERVDAAVAHAATLCSGDSGSALGISPHAPYSVRVDLLDRLIDVAREAALPMMMHLGETREELQLLGEGTGPFAEMLRSFGIWQQGLFPNLSVCDYIDRLTSAPRVLFAHGNYFGDAELDLLASRPNATIVYCPRTHAHFGHDPHPWMRMLDRGINVALGTDSRASNPDLSVWREALYLRDVSPECSPETLLQMLTATGRRAVTGDASPLGPGSAATFSVLRCDAPVREFWTLFAGAVPMAACVGGNWWN